MNTPASTRSLNVAIGSALLAGILCAPVSATLAAPPPLALANDYDDADIDLAQYWVSEKFDGVRAYWNGEQLLTRAGNPIHAPAWFTERWPRTPLDGELWAGRGQFETVMATVRDLEPDDAAWRRIRFMVFDLPAHGGPFDERLAALNEVIATLRVDWVAAVAYSRATDASELDRRLSEISDAGGEGLMLHRSDSLYRAERSDDWLKLKPYKDAEAQVVAYWPGKGKYSGLLGALEVRTADGQRFRIGTGFTDEQRRHPPAIGSWITYSYQSLTGKGIPRFARFLRAAAPPR